MHYKTHFTSYDLAARRVVVSIDWDDFRRGGAAVDEMVHHLKDILAQIGYRFNNVVHILGAADEPVQVMVSGYDASADRLAMFVATHVDAVSG